jgi:hypothetical protein
MALQNLQKIPKDLFVDLDGLCVRPKIEYLGKMAEEIPVLARQDGLRQIYTDGIVSVYNSLKRGEKDNYSSYSKNQPAVQNGTYSKESMVDILSTFGKEVLQKYWIWSEILDWQPEKRLAGYALPRGSNAVLYRNWSLSGDKIDASNAEVIPMKWMEKSGSVKKEIVKLSAPEDTYVWVNKERSIKNYDGLNALYWDLMVRVRPVLFSDWERVRPVLFSDWNPRFRNSYWGALLGSMGSSEAAGKITSKSRQNTRPN